MASSSVLVLVDNRGRFRSIYVSYGSADYLSKLLPEYYTDLKKVKELIKLGNCVLLGKSLDSSELVKRFGYMAVNNPKYNRLSESEKDRLETDDSNGKYSIFYGRDTDLERDTSAKVSNNFRDFQKLLVENTFLYIHGDWYKTEGLTGDLVNLETQERGWIDNIVWNKNQKVAQKVTHENTMNMARNVSKLIKGNHDIKWYVRLTVSNKSRSTFDVITDGSRCNDRCTKYIGGSVITYVTCLPLSIFINGATGKVHPLKAIEDVLYTEYKLLENTK